MVLQAIKNSTRIFLRQARTMPFSIQCLILLAAVIVQSSSLKGKANAIYSII